MATLGVLVAGMGLAGKVRCRDIAKSSEYASANPELNNVQLVGFSSRRDCLEETHTQIPYEDALRREDVNCVIICTENSAHKNMTKKALEAKKHVIVEFPIAESYPAVKEMFDLAHSNGVMLHEENIMLLTENMKEIIAKSKETKVKKASMSLKARHNDRLYPHVTEGGPIFSCRIHLLHCLLITCGPLTPQTASLTFTEVGQGQRDLEAKATLRSKDNAELDIFMSFTHDKNVPWTSSYEFEFVDGTVLPKSTEKQKPPVPSKPGLFMKDFISFVGIIQGSSESYLPKEISIEALRLADELEKMASGSS